jgi:hypothetical protein
MGKEMKIINWEQDFFFNYTIVSSVKTVDFVSDRVSYIVLRGCWCNIIALIVHASSGEKSDESKDSFYEDLSWLFIIFLSAISKFHYIFRSYFCLDNVAYY